MKVEDVRHQEPARIVIPHRPEAASDTWDEGPKPVTDLLGTVVAAIPTPAPIIEDDLAHEVERQRSRYENAARARREFLGAIDGARVRLQHLTREMIPDLGFGVAELMMVAIINGDLKPKSAKEAIEVAKLGIELARRESGEPDRKLLIDGPDGRERAIVAARELTAQLREANRVATPIADEPPIEDAVLVTDEELAAEAAAAMLLEEMVSIPAPSPDSPASLSTLRASTEPRDAEGD